MSEQAPATTIESVEPPKNNIDKGPYILEQKHFSGELLRGFSHYAPVFKTDNDAEIAASKKAIDEKYGDKAIVTLVNSSLGGMCAVKARNIITALLKPGKEDPKKLVECQTAVEARRQGDAILVTPEQADEVKPGERETTLQGFLLKAAKAAKENDFAEARRYMNLYNEKLEALGGEEQPQ